eukprot:g2574.t1
MANIQGQEPGSFGVIQVIRLEPTGINLGATGISSSYDDSYPPELEGWMAREEWLECMGRINSALMDRFPCGMCRLQAYCCCPCTLGLSLLSMIRQAKEVERGVGEVISSVNDNLEARRRNVRFGFHRGCCRAWVQVEYGSSISASSPSASKAPVSSYPGTSSSTGAVSNRRNQEGGRYSSGEQPENEGFERRRKATTTVEAMGGATQPLDEALLGRDATAAASPSAV